MTDDLERRRVRARLTAALFGAAPPVIRLGRYEILERIGSGGMSVVYAARDPRLDRKIALKIVSPLIQDPDRRREYQQRLVREGEALAGLAHPNVVAVFDIGESDDDVYLALELVDGRSLDIWLSDATRSWRSVLETMLAAGEGLAAAHEVGLVHRDVTPRNIVLDRRGEARVVDFGLVGALPDDDAAPATATALTRTGATMGTPPYMAPEQWLRGTVDARTDQFGFCVTLFEAVHGHRPFRGDELAELERAITSGAVEPRPADADAPAWLDQIVRRGLAVDPDARHPSMRALLDGIRDRLRSLDQTDDAELGLARLRALSSDLQDAGGAEAATEIDRLGLTARAACDAALSAWPGNQPAVRMRDEIVGLLVDHELARENADAAERLLAELSREDPERAGRVEILRARRAAIQSRLDKLDRIEHETDLEMAPEYKLGLLGLVAASQALAFLGFGYLTRSGHYAVGALDVGAFYALYLALHGASMALFRAAHFANSVNRNLSLQGAAAYGSHAALFLAFGWIGAPVATALVGSFILAIGLWLMMAIYVDARALIVPPGAAVAAIVTVVWPGACFEAAAAVAAIGIGGVALSWRPRERPISVD